MNTLFRLAMAAVFLLFFSAQSQARDQIWVVGSSTIYPFASYVAEEFGATTGQKPPIVESTGSVGGHRLFYAGTDMNTPDIVNSSRRMEKSEFKKNMQSGNKKICELAIGFDGIVAAFNKNDPDVQLSRKTLFLAVASVVPVGGRLVPNKYRYWDEINPSLPHRKILIFGPPSTSGTRDAFEELVMRPSAKLFKEYKNRRYIPIRQDGAYVPAGENDNLIVQKLIRDKEAFGIFGYSYLEQNSEYIKAASIDGISPTFQNISSRRYPLSRMLYFYVKMNHMNKVPGIQKYVDLFLSEKMTGDNGLLAKIGLIPLPAEERVSIRAAWKKHTALDQKNLTE